MYTVQRCGIKNDLLFGPTHGSTSGNETICGQNTDHYWYIINNTFDGIITCKKCLKILSGNPLPIGGALPKATYDLDYCEE